MPKVKRIRSAALVAQSVRHAPLGQVIHADENRNKYATVRNRRGQRDDNDDDDDDQQHQQEGLLDERTSKKIMQLSREQQLEMEAEEEQERRRRRRKQQQKSKVTDKKVDEDDDIDDKDVDNETESVLLQDDEDGYVQHGDGYVMLAEDAPGLTEEDEAAVATMMGGGGGYGERKTLADMILEKIELKEAEKRGEVVVDTDEGEMMDLPPKVVEVYTDIGKILSRYTSGKLPKAFKVIPSLSNWEEILYLTRPDMWTPQAMFAATRIFASNLNPKMAQRFYNLVLLDSVRADIYANKKLNYHYYMALKKAVYKPAAFFKGILLPLCKEECTLREAAIVASVLQRVSIPVHHSAVAIHKLAQQHEYNGASSIFIKTLLNKKYSLPAPVIGGLVQHFGNFGTDDRQLPVLWHQCLLVFCQRYKNELQTKARDTLKAVMKKHFHPKITPEIRRELFGAQAWKDERALVAGGGSVAMEL